MIITDKSVLEMKSEAISDILTQVTVPGLFDKLKKDLTESKTEGIGLAAVQIGIHLRACYIKYKEAPSSYGEGKTYEFCMINPTIKMSMNPFVFEEEGCLSLPGQKTNTTRFQRVVVEYYEYEDNTLEVPKQKIFSGVLAVCVQHEVDHMNGILNYRRVHREFPLSRNDSCGCGSGKKYKKCCLV